jgi:hypothetical protein
VSRDGHFAHTGISLPVTALINGGECSALGGTTAIIVVVVATGEVVLFTSAKSVRGLRVTRLGETRMPSEFRMTFGTMLSQRCVSQGSCTKLVMTKVVGCDADAGTIATCFQTTYFWLQFVVSRSPAPGSRGQTA